MTVHRSARWRGWSERYRETTAWTDLSLASLRQRENIFEHVLEAAGRQPFAKITTASIMAGRDRRAKTTPAQARKFLDTMRGLFRWAVRAKLLKVDPTAGVANPSAPNSDGFTPWSIEDITAYEARWPIGTRQRVWLDVLVYTGLRRGDAVRFGRQHIRNCVGTIKTEKTDTVVTLPILPVLMKTQDAGPCGDLTFIAGEAGRPLTKESFGNLFRMACRDAEPLRTWTAQGRGYSRRRERCHCLAAQCDLRLEGSEDGDLLHRGRRSTTTITRCNALACERQVNILFPHLCPR
jgi:integrase